ncbi:hypothetical protein LTR36_007063 [Oleoguttula mirabilis]|uniref:Uncharacterized protein n=1 Tax=Oleoguttula mirabilis TaxID=1507867 RepID=A0AAV9JBP2_9PEZI|nr:hypothetical protein LTR36_007063 [Oleoguttula mirabilis]
MKTIIAISALALLAAAAPRGFPPATTNRINAEVPSSVQPGGIMLPTGSVFPTFSGSGLPSFPTGSGFSFPSGGFPSGAYPSGGFPYPSGGFHHGHRPHGTGLLTGAAAPTSFAISARNAAASFTEPIESGSAFSSPASGLGVSESGFAKPTGVGNGGHSFSFPAFGSGGAESGFAKPTGFGGEKPSFSFTLPTESGSGFALPTGFGKEFKHKGHGHPAGTGSVSGFAAPTGGFPSGTFSGLPSGSFSIPKPTGTGAS